MRVNDTRVSAYARVARPPPATKELAERPPPERSSNTIVELTKKAIEMAKQNDTPPARTGGAASVAENIQRSALAEAAARRFRDTAASAERSQVQLTL